MNAWEMLGSYHQLQVKGPLWCPQRFADDRADFEKWYFDLSPVPKGRIALPRPKPISPIQMQARTVADMDEYPRWRFLHRFSREERNHFLCVYAKLQSESLWWVVKAVDWAGPCGVLVFYPDMPEEPLRHELVKANYSDHWLADHESSWGVRSRKAGCQLHFRGSEGGGKPMNVHIDLNNPGILTGPIGAVCHYCRDLKNRKTTHTLAALRRALVGQGSLAIGELP